MYSNIRLAKKPAILFRGPTCNFPRSTYLHKVINQMSQDKAPGPDGFTGLFFQSCWPIMRQDISAAINSVYNARCQDLNLLNKANIILLKKKREPKISAIFGL
jgi:hypothetical protein